MLDLDLKTLRSLGARLSCRLISLASNMKRWPASAFSLLKVVIEPSVMIAIAESSSFRAGYVDGISKIGALAASSRDTSEPESNAIVCRLTAIDTMLSFEEKVDIEHNAGFNHQLEHQYGCIPIFESMESDQLYTIILPDDILMNQKSEIIQGKLLVTIHGAKVTNTKEIHWRTASSVRVIESIPHRLRHLQELPSTTGTRYVYIVRVSTVDSAPTKSLEDLKRGMFNASTVSFRSQFSACSFGKLQWRLAGGIDIFLEQSIQSFDRPSDVLDAAMEAAKAELDVGDLRTLADHFVFCQPPGGTIEWVASGAVNHWVVNIHNDFCLSLSVLMHEVGHNLGLLHSALGDSAYGDISGYLGYGARSETWPQKCFNGVKSWQLGWYQERHLKVDDPGMLTAPLMLAAFVDYQETNADQPVIINIADRYFLMYNRAKSFNTNTQALRNQVTVTKKTPTRSTSLAGLNVGESLSLPDYRPGTTLKIEVCSRKDIGCDRRSISVDFMIICAAFTGMGHRGAALAARSDNLAVIPATAAPATGEAEALGARRFRLGATWNPDCADMTGK